MVGDHVLLSGFSDEASASQDFREQLAVVAALGMKFTALRFLDVGQGGKNAMQLERDEIRRARELLAEYDVRISSLGSPLGKVKLLDVEDGTTNWYVPFDQYLRQDVTRACKLAHTFDVKLVRGFSFYPPRGDDPVQHLPQAIDQLGRIVDTFQAEGLTYGLEVEANLVGQSGQILQQIHRQLSHRAIVLVFDAANLVMQGFNAHQVREQFDAMRDGLGWLHIKDCLPVDGAFPGAHVNEDAVRKFVPAGLGAGSYREILLDVRARLPELAANMHARGAPGVFLELEPHLRGGGQFGGFSGPDGYGVALRALCHLLDQMQLPYQLRQFQDVATGS